MPYSEEAEMGLIGAAMLDWRKVVPMAVAAGATEDAIWDPGLRLVWGAILELFRDNEGIDPLTVGQRLKRQGQWDNVGGQVRLERIVDATPAVEHAEWYLAEVRSCWDRRRAIEAATDVMDAAYKGERPGKEILLEGAERFAKVLPGLDGLEANEVVADRVLGKWEKAAEHRGESPDIGLRLPWKELTEAMGGLRAGLHILGGRQSAGKTSFVNELAFYLAGHEGKHVVQFTLDSTHEELVGRDLAREAGVSLPKMRFGFARKDQLAAARVVRDEYAAMGQRMRIVTNVEDVDDMCSLAWGLRMQGRLDLMTVDYVSVVEAYRSLGPKSATELRAKLVYVSKRLKRFGLNADVPVVALSQLNDRSGKEEPDSSYLLESGSLERDAFSVGLLYKDQEVAEAWDAIEVPWGNVTKKLRPVWWKLDKLKDGAAPVKVALVFMPNYFSFRVMPNGQFPSDPVAWLNQNDGGEEAAHGKTEDGKRKTRGSEQVELDEFDDK